MKEIVIISGKGGTGKTSFTGALCKLFENKVIVDCDVDAPNLHLILKGEILSEYKFDGGWDIIIEKDKCIGCGKCKEVCKFEAISFDGPSNDVVKKTYRIDPLSCEGCMACTIVCPMQAIRATKKITGKYMISTTEYGTFIHAKLFPGEENSGRLVSIIRQKARDIATKNQNEYVIVDGPPGTGCPVISSITGANYVIIVVEPTSSGIHDMKRVVELCRYFGIAPFVCINKSDINTEKSLEIKNFLKENSLEFLGEIPYDLKITEAMKNHKNIIDFAPNTRASECIKNIYSRLKNLL